MRQRKIGNLNIWKWAFLLLLSCLLGLSIVVISRVTTSRENTTQISSSDSDAQIGTFTTTRDQLNDTVATYLEEYQTKDSSYKLYATNQQVLFEASYEVFGTKVPLYIYFQPNKLENGNILLTITEISAGTLSLPTKEILTYVQKSYKLPSFVTVDAEQSTVSILLTEIENDLGIYIKANTIDLYNDQIIFDLYKKSTNSG
ncbi:TPA: YpmS family protein [Streptococcus suis]